MQVIIDEVISRVRAIHGRSGMSQEDLRDIADAVLALLRRDLDHDRQVQRERSTGTGAGGEGP
jgi:hypothetical protein